MANIEPPVKPIIFLMTKKTTPAKPTHTKVHNVQNFTVTEPAELLEYLLKNAFPERSRTSVKQLLRDGYFAVNGERTSQFDRPLGIGDVVSLMPNPRPEALRHPLIKLLYSDDYIVVIEKQAGISTVASGTDHKNTALRITSDYLKHVEPGSMIFMLNRLDKETAGIILFARDHELQQQIIANWRKVITLQRFMVVAEGQPEEDEGLLKGGEAKEKKEKNGAHGARCKSFVPEGIGTAQYKVMKRGVYNCMLRVDLIKGRNPQIRKQLAEMGMPVVGDYHKGSKQKKLNALALLCTRLEFIHPVTHEKMVYNLPVPSTFNKWVRLSTPRDMTEKGDTKI